MKCPVCGAADIAVSETGAGTVNVKCHRCELSAYAKPGTRAARLIRAAMTPDDDAPAPKPAAAAPPVDAAPKATPPAPKKNAPEPVKAAAAAAPAVKKIPNSVFSLSDL